MFLHNESLVLSFVDPNMGTEIVGYDSSHLLILELASCNATEYGVLHRSIPVGTMCSNCAERGDGDRAGQPPHYVRWAETAAL